MHDPSTVAFDIKRPWPIYRRQAFLGSHWYWPTLITIWHIDPECDGTDDSCGWSRPKLTKAQLSDLTFFAGCEARSPWYLRDRGKQPNNAAEAEVKLRGAFLFVGQRLNADVRFDEASEWASQLLHNPIDNLQGSLCHLPGWHTNFQDDDEDQRRDAALSLFTCIAKFILRERRPWYRHPRWHLQHWRLQVHPVQAFKRWAFSRCAGCGRRFTYGYSPTSFQWDSDGPQWFHGERGVYHSQCSGSSPAHVKPPAHTQSV